MILRTSDWFIFWVHLTPKVASPFAFFHVVADNASSSGVRRREPCQVNAVFIGADYFRRSRRTWECLKQTHSLLMKTYNPSFTLFHTETAKGEERSLTQTACSDVLGCQDIAQAFRVFSLYPVAVLSTAIYVRVSVGRLSESVSDFNPGVSSQLLPLQVVFSHLTAAIILRGLPFKLNGSQWAF